MDFYAEVSIQSNSGERYLFPAVLDRKTVDEARASLSTLVAQWRQEASAVGVAFGPVPINEVFGPGIETLVRNHLGHVRAGMLKISELEFVDAFEHDGESPGVIKDDDGRICFALKDKSYPLFRMLGNSESTQLGEVFAVVVPPGEQIGAFSPVFEAYAGLEAEHQSMRLKEKHDT